MKKYVPFLVVILLLTTITSHAQLWTSTNGPIGGDMLQIATNGQVILASTTSSLYRSVDGGASWSRIPSGQLFGLVTIGQDFVSIGVHGGYFSVRRSTDGITWTTLRQGNGEAYLRLAAHNNKLVITSPTVTGSKILISEDGGATWVTRDVPYSNIQSLYVFGQRIMLAINTGFAQSFDNGNTWSTGSVLNFTAGVNSVVLSGGYMVAVRGSTPYISADNGVSWSTVVTAGDVLRLFPFGDVLFGSSANSGLKRSIDHGHTWEALPSIPFELRGIASDGQTTYFATSAGVFGSEDLGEVVSDLNASISGLSYTNTGANAVTDGTNIYAGTSTAGVFMTADDGQLWTRPTSPLTGFALRTAVLHYSNGRVFSAAPNSPIYYSDDAGQHWNRTSQFIGHVNAFLSTESLLIAGSFFPGQPGLFRSTNNGLSWEPSANGIPVGQAIIGLAQVNGSLYAIGPVGLFRSDNLGLSWAQISQGGSAIYAFNNVLFVLNNGLYRSTDGGVTFTRNNVTPFAFCFAQNQNTVFLGTENGVYYSPDNGATWRPYGLPGKRVFSLLVKDQTLFACVQDSPVMKTPLLSNSIAFGALPEKVYGDQPLALSATTNSGLSVFYSSDNSDVARVDGDLLTIRGAGQATITAFINDGFDTKAQQTLIVHKAPLTVTADNASMIYGDNIPPLTMSYSGFIGSDDVSVIDQAPQPFASIPVKAETKKEGTTSTPTAEVKEETSGEVLPMEQSKVTGSFPNAGTYTINVVGGLDNNYQIIPVAGLLTINKAPLTVRPQDIEREYGEANPQITLIYEGFKGTEDQTQLSAAPITSTDAEQFSDADEYTITVEGGSATNYDVMTVNGTLTVTKAPLVAIAESKTIAYGETPQLTYVYSGFKGSDDTNVIDTAPAISIDERPDAQETGSQFLNVGDYTIMMAAGNDNNYELTYQDAMLHVMPAPLDVKVQDVSRMYGDANPEFALVYTGFKGAEDATVIDAPPQASTLADGVSPVGVYPVSLAAGGDNNYQLNLSDGSLTIERALLTVIGEDKSKVYGEVSFPELTIRYEGFKGTDDPSVLQVVPIASTTVSAMTDAGAYPIVVQGGQDDNYAFHYVNGVYTVKKAQLIATAANQEAVYGHPLPEPSLTFSGFIGDDDVTVLDNHPVIGYKIPATSFEIKGVPNAGSYGIGVGQPLDNNYEIIPVPGKLIINKAVLYVDFVPVEALYMDPIPKIVLQYHGFQALDPVKYLDGVTNLEKVPRAFIDGQLLEAGRYPVVISGGADNNYDFEYFQDGYVLIKPATLRFWVEPQTIEYGNDDQLDLTLHYDGFKGLEDVSVLDVPPVAKMPGYEPEPGSQFLPAGTHLIDVTTGADNNYEFVYEPSFAHIDKAPLFARAVDATKTYGDENPQFAVTFTGLKGSETSDVIDTPPIGTTTANTMSPVGTYPIILGDGLDNNYDITVEEGTLTITQAPLTVTADDRSKMYGQEFWMLLSVHYQGFKGTDDAIVLDVLPTVSTSVTATSDAGSYPIIAAGGSDLNYAFTYVDGVFTVNKVTLTATADDKTRVYGAANPEFTLTYAGFVNGQDASVIDMHPTLLDEVADALSPPGTYPIYFDGGSDINYDFTHVPGTLTITELTTPVPGKPTSTCYLTSPANNATNVNYYVTLTSNFVAGATTYTMEVSTSADFPVGSTLVKLGKQDIPFLLQYDTRYYVRIQTDQEPGVWSVTSIFTTGNPLTLAYLTSPEDGAAGVPTNVKVTANNLYGATSYTVELNTNPEFSPTTSITETGTERGISFKKLEKATTYYARVTSDLTPGQWGPATSFSTLNPQGRSSAWKEDAMPEFETDGISYNIYPNPFTDKIIVHVQTLEQSAVELTLFDVRGKMHDMKTARTNTLVAVGEGVARGVYLLQVVTPRGRKFVRVVKE